MKKLTYVLIIALLIVSLTALIACDDEEIPSGTPSGSELEVSERTINVTVLDGSAAVSGAGVYIRSTDYSATTDASGKCQLVLSADDSSADYYSLIVKKTDYLDAGYKVNASDFSDNVADVTVSIYTEDIVISGSVSCGDVALQDVLVSVSSDDATAITDKDGNYSLVIPRPIESFSITFSKSLYADYSLEITDLEKSLYTVNAVLSENSFNVEGTVAHYFNGAIDGATVKVVGTDTSVTTDSEGNFSISDIKGLDLPYRLAVTKTGSQTAIVKVEEADAELEIELVDDPVKLGILSPSNKNYSMSVVRDSKGIWFYFDSAFQFVDGDKLCIYIDVNETGTVSVGSSVLEFALCGDCDAEGNPIALVWNLKTSQSVTETAEIEWGKEVIYNLYNTEEGSYIEAFISYDVFAKAGADFAIDYKSVVGISFFDRGSNSSGAVGWDSADFPGADGANWVHPDRPYDFVRLAPENVIYEAADNTYVPYIDYNVVINVQDEEGNAINGASVNMVYPYEISKIAEEGEVAFVLNGKYFNKEPRFTAIAEGYAMASVTIARTEFVDGSTVVDITLKENDVILSGTGKVSSLSGALQGVSVSVEGYEGSVLTDADGSYDISTLNIDAKGLSSYQLVFSKDGYDNKTLNVTIGMEIDDVTMLAEARNLGTFGNYGWNVTIDRSETKLIVDLVSAHNWYGKTDLDGNTTFSENELQIYFVTDLTAKSKTADGLRELTIVEKVSQGGTDWAGWRDGSRSFLTWPGITYSVYNGDDGCKVHVEVAYSLLGIDKGDTVGLALGEWYGQETAKWSCPFYTSGTQTFVTSGWAVNVNDPSTSLHWAADNSTKVVYVAE